MPHYPCSSCCGFTPTCSPEDIAGCFPQDVTDTEFTVTIPSHSGANPACASMAGDYVLTWDALIDGWSYTEEDFFSAGQDLRLNLIISCIDNECYVILSALIPGALQPDGATWASVSPIDSGFPLELVLSYAGDALFPCTVDGLASAYVTAITGF